MSFEWSVDSATPFAEGPLPRLNEGQRVGPYRVEARLGHGGMGEVYRARHEESGQLVALKVLRHRKPGEQQTRFQREAELAARLSHVGIVRVYALGEHHGAPWLAQELIEDARTLDLASKGLSLSARLELFTALVEATAHAHAHGVVHRDLKPQNVLVDAAGRPRIADFGLATAGDLDRLTQTGVMVGTPTHMPLEQLEGGGNPASRAPGVDVYALGAILYRLLCGRPHFFATTMVELVAQIGRGQIDPPSDYAPEVPAWLDALCLRALARKPADRFADAGELLQALREPPQRSSRATALALVGGCALLLLAGAAAFALDRRRDAIQAERPRGAVEALRLRSESLARLRPELEEALAQLEARGAEAAAGRELLDLCRLASGQPPASPLPERTPLVQAVAAWEAGQLLDEAQLRALREAELPQPELGAWQIAGELEGGSPSALSARRGLILLRRLPPRPAWQLLSLRLHAFLGERGRARDLLSELASAPPEARRLAAEACALAELPAAARGQSEALERALAALPAPPRDPRSLAWRRVVAGALAKHLDETMLHDLRTSVSPLAKAEELRRIRERLALLFDALHACQADVTPDPELVTRYATALAVSAKVDSPLVERLSRTLPRAKQVQLALIQLLTAVPTMGRGRAKRTLTVVERALGCELTSQERSRLILERASCLRALGRAAEAVPLVRERLAAGSDLGIELQLELARCHAALKDYPAALAAYRELLERGSGQLPLGAYLGRAEAYYALGMHDEGAVDALGFLRRCSIPNTNPARILRAATLLWPRGHLYERELRDTLRRFRDELADSPASDPESASWLVRLAWLQDKAGEQPEALRTLSSPQLKPLEEAEAVLAQARRQLGQGQSSPALAALVERLDAKRVGFRGRR